MFAAVVVLMLVRQIAGQGIVDDRLRVCVGELAIRKSYMDQPEFSSYLKLPGGSLEDCARQCFEKLEFCFSVRFEATDQKCAFSHKRMSCEESKLKLKPQAETDVEVAHCIQCTGDIVAQTLAPVPTRERRPIITTTIATTEEPTVGSTESASIVPEGVSSKLEETTPVEQPTTTAPVVTTTAAPDVPTTAAPDVTTTAAPVVFFASEVNLQPTAPPVVPLHFLPFGGATASEGAPAPASVFVADLPAVAPPASVAFDSLPAPAREQRLPIREQSARNEPWKPFGPVRFRDLPVHVVSFEDGNVKLELVPSTTRRTTAVWTPPPTTSEPAPTRDFQLLPDVRMPVLMSERDIRVLREVDFVGPPTLPAEKLKKFEQPRRTCSERLLLPCNYGVGRDCKTITLQDGCLLCLCPNKSPAQGCLGPLFLTEASRMSLMGRRERCANSTHFAQPVLRYIRFFDDANGIDDCVQITHPFCEFDGQQEMHKLPRSKEECYSSCYSDEELIARSERRGSSLVKRV